MADDNGSDDSELDEVRLPIPPLAKKRRRSTSFAKCIICQSDSSDNLRKGKKSSVANLISKLKIRQDDVYDRLISDFDDLYENDVLWHASCYATYTSKQNIKYASNKASTPVEVGIDQSTDASVRVSRSSITPHDWSKCLFCRNRTYKKEKGMQNISTFEAVENIRQCAEAKGDQYMLHVLLGVNKDLVAAEAKYHKTCYASYVSKSNLKSQAFKEESGKESVYDTAFHFLVSDIKQGLESGRAYDMSYLLRKYIEFLEQKGIDGQGYTRQKLKLRMKSYFREDIVFHQLNNKTSPELVYSSSISLQDVINASAIRNNKRPLLSQPDHLNHSSQEPSPTLLLYRAAKLLKEEIKQCKGISIYPINPNDIDLATVKSIVPRDLYLFLRWMVTNDDVNIDCESSCNNTADERKVLCLSQDAIHCTSHGKVKLPKHVGLAMSVRHTTGSKQLVTILNRMGHCSSYDEIESVDTGLAKEVLAKSQQSDAVIPSNISPGSFIQFAADNNDINEETLDGKNTTHATTLVVYQKKTFGPMPQPKVYADQTRKQRSLERITVVDEILECSAHGKRPAVKDFIGKLNSEANIFTTTNEYDSSCSKDLTWALARISPTKLFTATDHTREEDTEPVQQNVPGWSGYNSLVYPNTTLPTVIGYCPMLNGSSTEFSTIYTIMKKAQSICASLGQKDTAITFDLAIYCKAKLITWKYPEEFTDTVIRLGGFHVALNFLAVLGKRYQSSGIEDLMIESGAYGTGTVASLMKGKSYNRGIRAHKLTMEAVFRLMWQAFIQWLNAESQQAYKSDVEEKQLVDSMRAFNLTLKSKVNVPQKSDSITHELETVMKLFNTFRQEEKARSSMFAFWDEYIRMVIMLLQFVKAERTRNWPLHLESVSAMIPYFFAHDRPNYARWLPVYVAEMRQLEQKHPTIYQEFLEGQHTVSRSSQPFASVWTDMALEQSINLDSKSKGGIVGISQNADALQRWFLTSHERAAVTSAVKQMCGIGDSDRVGSHKEAAPKRVERDENDVQKILSCFKSGLMKDPFSEDCESLSNIATGVVLPAPVADELVKSEEKGKEQMNSFTEQRLNTSNRSIWEPIQSLKIKTFSSTTKNTTIKCANEKLEIVTEDRDLFGRLLIVANVRQVNLKEILCFELSSVPYSLAHIDGTLRKTTKSVLLQILEKEVTVEPRLTFTTEVPTVYVLDAMAFVQMLKFAGASTFGEMAIKYFDVITTFFREGCKRIDVVFDQYWQLSIKAGERKKRGESSALEVRIHGASTPVPKQFPKYISNATNKVNLSAFLTEAWVEMAKHLSGGKELVIGGGTTSEHTLSIKNGECHEVAALHCDHEEADTRIILHAQHASHNAQRIVLQSPDTDVLLLCVTHYDEIGCQELWFRTGVKDRLRYIPVHKIAVCLGQQMCKALPAFHSLTGCDSTSALFRLGKRKAWNSLMKSKAHQESLASVGQSPDVDVETASAAEAFICSLYATTKKSPTTADEARYLLFCQKTQNNLLLPPTSDSLKQHITRANFQAYVWRKALVARQDLPSPVGCGWLVEDGDLCPVLMTKPPAPSSILELTNCKCSIKSNCTKNCSCSNNGLACTEACRCMADENCYNPNKACCYESDEDDLSDVD